MEVEITDTPFSDKDTKCSTGTNGQIKGKGNENEMSSSYQRVTNKRGKSWMDSENDPGESMSDDSSFGETIDDAPKSIWEDLELLQKKDARKQKKQPQNLTKQQEKKGKLQRTDYIHHGKNVTDNIASLNKRRTKSVKFSEKKSYNTGYYNEGRNVVSFNSPSMVQTKQNEHTQTLKQRGVRLMEQKELLTTPIKIEFNLLPSVTHFNVVKEA